MLSFEVAAADDQPTLCSVSLAGEALASTHTKHGQQQQPVNLRSKGGGSKTLLRVRLSKMNFVPKLTILRNCPESVPIAEGSHL